ncbi:hypothetical protein AB0F88_16690 [Streptosporangium sp. NPDC023963]|uniref:hypothetical protein n=1 Tax=Streptosporangium sp. NPDC023963 TaxID=3155608 RepID=UPI003429F84E
MNLSPISWAALALASMLSTAGLALFLLRPRRTHDAGVSTSPNWWMPPVSQGGLDEGTATEQEAHLR